MKDMIEVGQIVNTHGLKGEVKIMPWTDFPEVFEMFEAVYTKDQKQYDIEDVRYQKGCVLAKLSGIDDVDEAEKMRNKTLYVNKELFDDLPEDTYLVTDIIGLVLKDSTTEYGKIDDVISTGSNDVYVVGKILVPAIKEVVKEINIKDGYVLVEMPKGLID